jgi:hypothetical protein
VNEGRCLAWQGCRSARHLGGVSLGADADAGPGSLVVRLVRRLERGH